MDDNMEFFEKNTPFRTFDPVSPDNFVGRDGILKEYNRELSQVYYGDSRHLFLIGNKGMGKSSLATFLIDWAKKKYDMVGIYVYNGGINTIEELIINVIEQILNQINDEKWFKKIVGKFRDNIETVGFFGTSIKFKPKDEDIINSVKDNFDSFLVDLVSGFEDRKGIFIVIDDINGLSNTSEFAYWYKSFADSLSTNYRNQAPILIMLTGYPDKYEKLYNHNPSFVRVFKPRYLENLEDFEVKDFFTMTFNKLGITIDDDALELMVHFSSGIPLMMQEIGDGVFWINEGDVIDKNTAIRGILRAGAEIGVKYLKPVLDSSIRSEKYLSIFNKLGNDYLNHVDSDYSFRKKDFISNLNPNEEKVFSDFLRKARQLGIIDFKGAKNSGHYKFTNNLYGLYFAIVALKDNN